jgi:hypothetical protein
MKAVCNSYGYDFTRFAILVPLVCPGGLGSCSRSQIQSRPTQAAFVFLSHESNSAKTGTVFGPPTKEQPMPRSSFDFDVITGPARIPPKPAPKPQTPEKKPQAEAAK